MGNNQISSNTLWLITKLFCVVMCINGVLDMYVWFAYGFMVPSWVMALTWLIGFPTMLFMFYEIKKDVKK